MTEPAAKQETPRAHPTNPNQVASYLIDHLLAKPGDLFSGGTLSIRSLVNLLLVLSLGDIKECLRLLLVSIVPLIKRMPSCALMLFTKMIDMRKLMSRRVQAPALIESTPENHRFTINVSDHFMLALYDYINNNKDCTFKRSVCEASVTNLKDCFTTERISDICVGVFTIMDYIDYNINILTGEPTTMRITSTVVMIQPKPSSIASYLDLFNAKQQEMLSRSTEELKKTGYNEAAFMVDIDRNAKSYTEKEIAEMVVANYPQLDYKQTCYSIGVLFALYKRVIGNYAIGNAVTQMKEGKSVYFDPHNIYKFETTKGDLRAAVMNSYKVTDTWPPYTAGDIEVAFGDLLKHGGWKPKSNTKVTSLAIEIPHTIDEGDVDPLLKKFIRDVCQFQRKDAGINVTVKIYCLLLENEVTTTESSNPAYDQWLEKRKVIEELKKDSLDTAALDAAILDIPSKTISIETSKRTITIKLLNETRKGLDTLYLRKADTDKLLTSLDQFRNKKEVLADLGLPNKLNILLYGPPGTGKSTAIQTIATYLGRNIYYMDLNNVETNQDLQMLFEYVNKNVQNGGIIVIEDIDAMTDIVLKREPRAELRVRRGGSDERSSSDDTAFSGTRECRVNQLISNGEAKLSLEYLLNILQGTLTLDDSIFIVTTNHLDHLDPAFYRDGRFDVKIELKLCDRYQIQSIYYKFLNRRLPEALLERIPEGIYSPATIIFHIKDYLFAPDVSDEEILAKFLEDSQ